jgi:hypothetical protein
LSIADLETRVAHHHVGAVFAATGGTRVTQQVLAELRKVVVSEAEQAGFPHTAKRADRSEFDVDVAVLLHRRAGLVPAEASVRAAWVFLALVLMPDVAYWRFPEAPTDRILATDITRHVFGRLWWRAHLLHDPNAEEARGEDPYALVGVFGEAAFDQIFARRRSIGGSRAVVRALARCWPDLDQEGVDERKVLRDTLKQLLRLAAIVEFEALDDEGLNAEVESTARWCLAEVRRNSSP